MFDNRYPKYKAWLSYERNLQQWISEYQGVNDNENIAHYFENLSINMQNKNIPKPEPL